MVYCPCWYEHGGLGPVEVRMVDGAYGMDGWAEAEEKHVYHSAKIFT